LRHISWTATARRHKLTTRQYQIERDQTVIIALDAGRRPRRRGGGGHRHYGCGRRYGTLGRAREPPLRRLEAFVDVRRQAHGERRRHQHDRLHPAGREERAREGARTPHPR
ncbi:MAG: DUF58 domain-containing protein, partial [Candidatus Eisenbacteria bacterium]|nr:DUF58 domain-containing protein [Candidatus Eisenbacteria bacterium]